jgi:hypothetical protein
MDVRDAEVVDQPAEAGADVGAVRRRGAGREVRDVCVEDVAEGPWLGADVIDVDSEDAEDLAGGGEG